MNEDHLEGKITEAEGSVKGALGDVAGDAKTKVEGKIDEMSGQAQQAWGDARETIEAAAEKSSEALSEAAAQARHTLRGTAETVKAKASAMGGRVCKASTTAGSQVASTVKEQPVLALIGMAAIGYLVGYLLHSPSSPFAPEPRYRRVIRRWS